ncbi:MAG: hypothetical protein GWN73_12630, partial [Actinobacteria bacterium]|nr:hypothetical protein [Actinomycetota bacterium]NIU66212.1 hypothetical protein [Actinomycetota bacterium]
FAAIVNTGATLVLRDATLAATAMAEGGANGGHGLGIFGGGRLDARRLVLADDT